jgi:hypothetical protein
MFKTISLSACFFVFFLTLGCAPGIEYRKFWDSSAYITIKQPLDNVIFGIQDLRPYVLDGTKNENFVGRGLETMMTGILPVYIDYTTFSRKPLANDFSILLQNNFAKTIKNFKVVEIQNNLEFDDAIKTITNDAYNKYFLIRLNDFQFESGYVNTDFKYNISFDVIDSSGNTIESSTKEGVEELSGTIPGPGRIQLDIKVVDIFNAFFGNANLQ